MNTDIKEKVNGDKANVKLFVSVCECGKKKDGNMFYCEACLNKILDELHIPTANIPRQ